MQHNWILDVLSDLKVFAAQNRLPILAEQLDDTRLIAWAEIASLPGEVQASVDTGTIGRNTGSLGGNLRA